MLCKLFMDKCSCSKSSWSFSKFTSSELSLFFCRWMAFILNSPLKTEPGNAVIRFSDRSSFFSEMRFWKRSEGTSESWFWDKSRYVMWCSLWKTLLGSCARAFFLRISFRKPDGNVSALRLLMRLLRRLSSSRWSRWVKIPTGSCKIELACSESDLRRELFWKTSCRDGADVVEGQVKLLQFV